MILKPSTTFNGEFNFSVTGELWVNGAADGGEVVLCQQC